MHRAWGLQRFRENILSALGARRVGDCASMSKSCVWGSSVLPRLPSGDEGGI